MAKIKVKPVKAWARVTEGKPEIDVECICYDRIAAALNYPVATKEGRIIPVLITPIVPRTKRVKPKKARR